jgi:hypothetical protein
MSERDSSERQGKEKKPSLAVVHDRGPDQVATTIAIEDIEMHSTFVDLPPASEHFQRNAGERSSRASGVKAPRIVISEESFARLIELEGDAGLHVNKAIDVYLLWLQAQEAGRLPTRSSSAVQAYA